MQAAEMATMNECLPETVTVLGQEAQCGAYLLRIRSGAPLAVRFGRYRQGAPVALAAGDYLYVGSAMGRRGASTLARRLVRHATRRKGPPHNIHAQMLATFAELELGTGDLRPRGSKRLFWHVDYLLEQPEVTLTHVLVIRSNSRLEQALATLLAQQPYTSTPAPGLGASDASGATHLFAVGGEVEGGWWVDLLGRVQRQWGGA